MYATAAGQEPWPEARALIQAGVVTAPAVGPVVQPLLPRLPAQHVEMHGGLQPSSRVYTACVKDSVAAFNAYALQAQYHLVEPCSGCILPDSIHITA